MNSSAPSAHARTDGEDRLVEGDALVVALQHRCGGEAGELLAVPALLDIVRRARRYGLKLSRPIQVHDGKELITFWAEIVPEDDGAGCRLALSNWQASELPAEEETRLAERRSDIDRELAEVVARLDSDQRLLSLEGRALDLEDFIARASRGRGRPWTDFVEIVGNSHQQPLHWRLLDGAKVRLAGSQRNWTVSLSPSPAGPGEITGFELLLVPDEPLQPASSAAPNKGQLYSAAIGREIAPVLRQPISRIIANAETIRARLAGPLADEYSNYAADIAAAGEHLLALIEDLTDLEVVEADDFSAAPDQIELTDVARRAVGILGVRAQERGIAIDLPHPDETAPATGEFRRVLQILLNLVGNAIRYSPEGSQIWIRVEQEGGRSRITVADQGPGIPEDQQPKIFDKFERLGRSNDGGTGLGLYIARRLARAMNGELSVESAAGQGARFTLDLPAAA